jgi:hypothetical protein
LIVDGHDLTQQEQRLTEAELEARFSASLLPRTLVFTQEDLLELLQVHLGWRDRLPCRVVALLD